MTTPIRVSELPIEHNPAASDLLLITTDEVSSFVSRRVSLATIAPAINALAPVPVELAGINMIIGHGLAVVTTGIKGHLEIPFACEIQSVTLVADRTGSIVIDIWRDTYANFPPTVLDSITATAKPTLSSAIRFQDTTLTGWIRTLAGGDILTINVDSAATLMQVTLSLVVRRL